MPRALFASAVSSMLGIAMGTAAWFTIEALGWVQDFAHGYVTWWRTDLQDGGHVFWAGFMAFLNFAVPVGLSLAMVAAQGGSALALVVLHVASPRWTTLPRLQRVGCSTLALVAFAVAFLAVPFVKLAYPDLSTYLVTILGRRSPFEFWIPLAGILAGALVPATGNLD